MGGEKLGNFKKLIAAVFISMAAIFCLYSQSQTSSQISENSIILSDTAGMESDSSQVSDYKGTSTAATFVRMIVALVLVVGLIYLVLLFIKKKTNVVKTEDEYLRRAAYINISPSKTVEVITLIDKAYLIGVTEDNITLLGEINDKELVEAMNINADKKANTKNPVNFSQVLESFLVKGKNKNVFSDTESRVDEIFNNKTSNNEDQ